MEQIEFKSRLARAALTDAQRSNAIDLLAAMLSNALPDEMTTGSYDGGVSFHWKHAEVACFEDRFETYQFFDGETVIHHWPRCPGQPIDRQMLAELRAAID